MNKNSNEESEHEYYKIPKILSSVFNNIVKPIIGFFIFLCIGYYTLWLSSNYVKKETFDDYIRKQDQLLTARFDSIQSKLETILGQQIITTEQFKNLNIILSTQQKSLDNISERVTFLERSYFKDNKENIPISK
jgi:hypothetical protein